MMTWLLLFQRQTKNTSIEIKGPGNIIEVQLHSEQAGLKLGLGGHTRLLSLEGPPASYSTQLSPRGRAERQRTSPSQHRLPSAAGDWFGLSHLPAPVRWWLSCLRYHLFDCVRWEAPFAAVLASLLWGKSPIPQSVHDPSGAFAGTKWRCGDGGFPPHLLHGIKNPADRPHCSLSYSNTRKLRCSSAWRRWTSTHSSWLSGPIDGLAAFMRSPEDVEDPTMGVLHDLGHRLHLPCWSCHVSPRMVKGDTPPSRGSIRSRTP